MRLHSIWKNDEFRGEFNKVGRLHDFFPNIPFVALSTTFPPHIVSLIHKMMGMRYPSDIITSNGRRTNINLLVTRTTKSKNDSTSDGFNPSQDRKYRRHSEDANICRFSTRTHDGLQSNYRKKLIKILPSSNPKNIIRTYYSSTDGAHERTDDFINQERYGSHGFQKTYVQRSKIGQTPKGSSSRA